MRRGIVVVFFAAFLAETTSASSLPEAVANHRWGVVQLVGHLTVNEDGEGSNPSAPANSSHIIR
jgi:hypothetical protein